MKKWRKRSDPASSARLRRATLPGFFACDKTSWCRDCPRRLPGEGVTAPRGPSLRKIVISTQADYCQEYFPLWYHWYTEIQHADDIFIIAAGTPQASVAATMAFYQGLPKIHIERLDLPNFEVPTILARHRNWLRELAPSFPFLVVSADSDQFFEFPSAAPMDCGLLFFDDVELVSEGVPSLQALPTSDLRELSLQWRAHVVRNMLFKREHRAGLLNLFNCPNVGGGGHCWPPEMPPRPFQRSYHWIFSGVEQFVQKVKSLSLQSNDRSWWHWPKWIAVFRAQGEEGLRKLYPEIIIREGASREVQAFKNRFAKGRS